MEMQKSFIGLVSQTYRKSAASAKLHKQMSEWVWMISMKIRICKNLVLLIGVCATHSAVGDEGDYSLSGVRLGESYEAVEKLLRESCSELQSEIVAPVSFPLASESEQHIFCKNLGEGGQIAVTFADGKAVHIYGKDLSESDISRPDAEPNIAFGYQIDPGGLFWRNAAESTVTLVTADGRHPNLFLWKNPRLEEPVDQPKPAALSTKGLPSILDFGTSIELLMPLFESSCDPLLVHDLEPSLPSSPTTQVQLDCFNQHFLGFPRKIEAVFGDGILELAWILTAKQEEERIRVILTETFGSPARSTENWEMYSEGTVYLRKDKPEVLAVSENLAPFYMTQSGE